MQEYQKRVVEEKSELTKKCDALSDFIGNKEKFKGVDPAEQASLRDQLDVMYQYTRVLSRRISAFQ